MSDSDFFSSDKPGAGKTSNSDQVKRIKEQINALPPEEKARLVQEILGSSGLQVVLGGGNFIRADVVLQIQSGEIDLGTVFQAAADRISKDDGNSQH